MVLVAVGAGALQAPSAKAMTPTCVRGSAPSEPWAGLPCRAQGHLTAPAKPENTSADSELYESIIIIVWSIILCLKYYSSIFIFNKLWEKIEILQIPVFKNGRIFFLGWWLFLNVSNCIDQKKEKKKN